ncbi:hypothetical protein SDJN03_01977, partial [Cucurbita argyrosperma subsp. sororia]
MAHDWRACLVRLKHSLSAVAPTRNFFIYHTRADLIGSGIRKSSAAKYPGRLDLLKVVLNYNRLGNCSVVIRWICVITSVDHLHPVHQETKLNAWIPNSCC